MRERYIFSLNIRQGKQMKQFDISRRWKSIVQYDSVHSSLETTRPGQLKLNVVGEVSIDGQFLSFSKRP
jgi:hypothetical protein